MATEKVREYALAGMRLQDDPLIRQMAANIDRLLEGQEDLKKHLLDPEHGIYRRLNDLEQWKKQKQKDENFRRQIWWRIIIAIITTFLATGGIFGYILHFGTKIP